MRDATMAHARKPDERRIFRIGGASAILLGLTYILITGVYIVSGALPKNAEAALQSLAGHTIEWWTILGMSALTDFLFLPVALALYAALKDFGRMLMLAGAGLLGMFVVLDLAVTWPNYAALIMLSGDYAAAVDDAQRMVDVAAATYAVTVLDSPVFTAYAILTPSVGILLISLVMMRSWFTKATAYSGIASGILGIIATAGPLFVPALGFAAVIASVCTTIWVLLAGVSLWRWQS